MTHEKIRILIVDDDQKFIDILLTHLRQDPRLDIQGIFTSPEDARDCLTFADFEVLLTDIKMPTMNGAELSRYAMRVIPRLRVLAMTAFDSDAAMISMLQLGAHGYVTKSALTTIADSIVTVATGGTAISPDCLTRFLKIIRDNPFALHPRSTRPEIELSDTEQKVLDLLCAGQSNSEIAEELHLSESTVKRNVSYLLSYYNVDSRLQLVISVFNSKARAIFN